MLDFTPSPAIFSALLSSASLPAFLLLLSHGPWKIAAPGHRFICATFLSLCCWGCLLILTGWSGLTDLVAGFLILATTILAGFTLWTLLAWGFTLSMLLALQAAGGRVSLTEWIARYTGGQTIDRFALDRLGVLFRARFAVLRGKIVTVTAHGRLVARVSFLLRSLFGLPA
jgi:hypothetical protein